jgi:hypothetical protein
VSAAGFPSVGIGFAGVALAFGLTVLSMAFAIGHISGCHLNPAVSVGLVVGKRFSASELPHYIIAQVLGAIAASGVLCFIASGTASFDVHAGFASNGYGVNSPGGYSMAAGFVAEVVLTAFFLIVIMGATDVRAAKGFAPIAIGLCLTLPDSDTPRLHSGDQHFREPCPQHRPCDLRRRLGSAGVVDVLGCTADRRGPGRGDLQGPVRRTRKINLAVTKVIGVVALELPG